MSESYYPPLEVYKNLPKIFGYRKLELSSGKFVAKGVKQAKTAKKEPKVVQSWLTDKAFMELIQWERYCIVEARDIPEKQRRYPKNNPHIAKLKTKTYFIILDQDFDIDSATLAKIINRIPDIQASVRRYNADIIVIGDDYLPIHPKKKLDQYESAGSDTAGSVTITNQLHTLFMHDLFARPGMPKFRIIPQAEEEKTLQEILLNKTQIERKSSKDPEVIILGAVPGDLLEIIAFNENTATMMRYGLVR